MSARIEPQGLKLEYVKKLRAEHEKLAQAQANIDRLILEASEAGVSNAEIAKQLDLNRTAITYKLKKWKNT